MSHYIPAPLSGQRPALAELFTATGHPTRPATDAEIGNRRFPHSSSEEVCPATFAERCPYDTKTNLVEGRIGAGTVFQVSLVLVPLM
jgi:hypothetical protein